MGGFENVVEVITSQPPMVMTLLPSRVHCKQTPKRLGDGAHLPQVPKEGARETGNPSVSPGRRSPPSPSAPAPAGSLSRRGPQPPGRRLTAAARGLLRRHGWTAAGHPVASSERLQRRALTPHRPARPERSLKPRREKNRALLFRGKTPASRETSGSPPTSDLDSRDLE